MEICFPGMLSQERSVGLPGLLLGSPSQGSSLAAWETAGGGLLGLNLHHVEGSMCSGPFPSLFTFVSGCSPLWKDAYGFIYYRLELYLLST